MALRLRCLRSVLRVVEGQQGVSAMGGSCLLIALKPHRFQSLTHSGDCDTDDEDCRERPVHWRESPAIEGGDEDEGNSSE